LTYSRKTLVLLLAVLSLGLRATVGYPAAFAELKARQCCARHCPNRSSATPDRCKCCRQKQTDERLLVTRFPAAVGGEPILFDAPQARPQPFAVARLIEAIDSRALGPPLFLSTHHIQR
jgi:hypothetical protein